MQSIFEETIEILNEIKVCEHIILIGSWAEYLYEKCEVIDDFVSEIRTQDIDLLIKNINKPREHVDILSEFCNRGYDVDVSGHDIYRLIKDDFEVEFLVSMKGGSYIVSEVPAFELKSVEALNHVHMLLIDPINVVYNGVQLGIPNPYNYVLHKMVINSVRKPDKREKDKIAIGNLMIYLDREKDQEKFLHYFNEVLTKKEKLRVRNYIKENSLGYAFNQSMVGQVR